MKKFSQMIKYIYFSKSRKQILRELPQKKFSYFIQNKGLIFSQCICSRKPITLVQSQLMCTSKSNFYSQSVSASNNEKNKNNLIYYGSLTSSVKGIKVFTCISSLGGLVLQPLILLHLVNAENLAIGAALYITVGISTFVMPFMIHLFTRKYVTEIRYIPETDTYIATTFSFFLRRINTDFKVEDVSASGALPIFATMSIKGRHVFIVSECFFDVSHYVRLMGYDKPLDLKLEESTEPNKKKYVEENQDNLNTKK